MGLMYRPERKKASHRPETVTPENHEPRVQPKTEKQRKDRKATHLQLLTRVLASLASLFRQKV